MSFSVIIRFRSIEQALTKSSQQCKCSLGKRPFKSTGEYIVIQLHHWLAVKPLYPDEMFEGSQDYIFIVLRSVGVEHSEQSIVACLFSSGGIV